ncbi:MAG: hypothetical protein GF387_00190 [Candidatus Portnoybacteria bacterium]|nr:hypothetical protein [Candidatus Portnoybacteria bacterium]
MVFKDKIFIFLILAIVVAGFIISGFFESVFNQKVNLVIDAVGKKEPVYSKGIYVTFRTAGTSRMNEIIDLIKDTELNTVVIDIKDYTGRVPFDTQSDLVDEIGSEKIYISDIEGLISKLKKEGIYTIARIAVFEDNFLPLKKPYLAIKTRQGFVWRDYRGIAWLDPASQEVWDYVVALAKEAARVGFDEVNLDYIRFPSDGNMSDAIFPYWDYTTPKKEVIRGFFEYVSSRIRPMGVYLSADLFGLTTTSTNDLNIGQWLEYAAPYFDYLCPMIYPSHYPSGHLGFANPAAHPYEVVYEGLAVARERLASMSFSARLRPWLQDFNLGAHYGTDLVNLQKQAVYDAGAFGWLFWNPRNIYYRDEFLGE